MGIIIFIINFGKMPFEKAIKTDSLYNKMKQGDFEGFCQIHESLKNRQLTESDW